MVNRVLSHLQLELGLERGILSLKVSLGSTFYRLSDRMGTGRTFQYANSECVVNQDCTWTHISRILLFGKGTLQSFDSHPSLVFYEFENIFKVVLLIISES